MSLPPPAPGMPPGYVLTMNLTVLGTSCKWNQTVFVFTYCILERIFKIALIFVLQTDYAFSPRPRALPYILIRYLLYTSVVYTCQSQSLHSSYPVLCSLCPYVCSLCLCLYFFFANRFISTVFLNSTYKH